MSISRAKGLTWALDGGEWSATRSGRFSPRGKKYPVFIKQKGGWVPQRRSQGTGGLLNLLLLCEPNHNSSAIQPVP